MTSKNIEVHGSNSIKESCVFSVESTVPEHLDAGINNGDDSFETWVSAESVYYYYVPSVMTAVDLIAHFMMMMKQKLGFSPVWCYIRILASLWMRKLF